MMSDKRIELLFILLRSAIGKKPLTAEEKALYDPDLSPMLAELAKRHDVVHLLALGLKNNGMLDETNKTLENEIFKAVYRYEQLNSELVRSCDALEAAKIPFIPLKGSVIRKYYPEPWMRTSCDIDILVREEDLNNAVDTLTGKFKYRCERPSRHDVSLYAENGVHIELHHTLLEDDYKNEITAVLGSVWENAKPKDGSGCYYEMPDELFYFYHIAHMAKHFEHGGCGIRPFLDLQILKTDDATVRNKRTELLLKGELLKFAVTAEKTSEVWFGYGEHSDLTRQVEGFILNGGAYGTATTLAQIKAGKGVGKVRSFLQFAFLSRADFELLYPDLKKRPYLLPVYRIKRWFGIFNKKKRGKAKNLTAIRNNVSAANAEAVKTMLEQLGL